MLFCDTSTIAKLYVPERESAPVRAVLENEDQVYASELVKVEILAVFHRQLREKKWPRDVFQAAIRQFTNDDIGGFWTWLPLDGGILAGAAKTFTTFPGDVFLRPSDCLHLVTAIQHGFPEIHTHDAHQTRAAAALGMRAVTL
jgi:predicted nucleic acid-binding protein